MDLGTDDIIASIPGLVSTQIDKWKQAKGLCHVWKNIGSANDTLVLLWAEDVRGDEKLAKLSLTRDGKRIAIPCTEDALREAFGEPDKIEHDG